MAISQEEQLQHLISQIQLADDVQPFFAEGRLKQVTVAKQAKTWTFHIVLNDILPVHVFMQFRQQLQAAFTNIAQTQLNIETPVQTIDATQVNQYWHIALADSDLNHAASQQLTSNTMLRQIDAQHFGIAVGAQLLYNVLTDTALQSISQAYRRYGFPELLLTPQQDEALAQQIAESVAQHHALSLIHI